MTVNWKEETTLNCQWPHLWDYWAQLFLSVKIGGSGNTKTETKAPPNPIPTTSQCSLRQHWWFLTLPSKSLQRGGFCSVLGSVLLSHLQGPHPSYTEQNWFCCESYQVKLPVMDLFGMYISFRSSIQMSTSYHKGCLYFLSAQSSFNIMENLIFKAKDSKCFKVLKEGKQILAWSYNKLSR